MRPRVSRGRSRSDNTSNNLSGGLVRVRDRFPERARALSLNRLREYRRIGTLTLPGIYLSSIHLE
jgi:hypothetical protein